MYYIHLNNGVRRDATVVSTTPDSIFTIEAAHDAPAARHAASRSYNCRRGLTVAEEEEAHRQRRRHTCWVKPWLQQRPLLGQYDTLMRELMREAYGDFKRFLGQAPFFSRGMLVRYVFSSSRKQQINNKFFPATFVQVAHASSSQNVMSIWTSRHMFDQFSFTRFQ